MTSVAPFPKLRLATPKASVAVLQRQSLNQSNNQISKQLSDHESQGSILSLSMFPEEIQNWMKTHLSLKDLSELQKQNDKKFQSKMFHSNNNNVNTNNGSPLKKQKTNSKNNSENESDLNSTSIRTLCCLKIDFFDPVAFKIKMWRGHTSVRRLLARDSNCERIMLLFWDNDTDTTKLFELGDFIIIENFSLLNGLERSQLVDEKIADPDVPLVLGYEKETLLFVIPRTLKEAVADKDYRFKSNHVLMKDVEIGARVRRIE